MSALSQEEKNIQLQEAREQQERKSFRKSGIESLLFTKSMTSLYLRAAERCQALREMLFLSERFLNIMSLKWFAGCLQEQGQTQNFLSALTWELFRHMRILINA